jgi:uridylate kinase
MKRILLKVSGEALKGDKDFGYSSTMLQQVADDIFDLHQAGYQISIVVGGGNIFRGVNGAKTGIKRVNSDYMGMLATVMNAIALGDTISSKGIKTKVMSAIKMDAIVETYSYRRACSFLENNEVVIFGGGTGNPYFTTDTAATLRAIEMNSDILLKATKVDGVYNKDPMKFEDAILYKELSYDEAIDKGLKIMDLTAFALASDNNLEIIVFNLFQKGNLLKAVKKETGTLVKK